MQREFYAEVATALGGFLGDKLNIAEAGMIREEVAEMLRDASVSREIIEECLACLDQCDRQRFAPSDADETAMSAFLSRVESVMSRLDRELAK